jgi:signal transduction histidine kinase
VPSAVTVCRSKQVVQSGGSRQLSVVTGLDIAPPGDRIESLSMWPPAPPIGPGTGHAGTVLMSNTAILLPIERRRDGVRSRRSLAQVVLVGLGLALPSVLIPLLWAERRRRARVEQELHRLSIQLLTAQEDERARIGRDLHDDIGQQLALIAVELDLLRGSSDEGVTAEALDGSGLAGRIRTVATDVHEIARQLHPARLEHLGLVEAVRGLGREMERLHGVEVEVSAIRWPGETPRWLGACLYRVAQEALQNVMKHSGARTTRLVLDGSSRELKMTIADRGRGFEPAVVNGAGLGLISMRERLRAVGGTLALRSVPGRGTLVEATVPRPGR